MASQLQTHIPNNEGFLNTWIYDSGRKERINTNHMTPAQADFYKGDNDTIYRPDLNAFSSFQFKLRFEVADRFGNRIRDFYKTELLRQKVQGYSGNKELTYVG